MTLAPSTMTGAPLAAPLGAPLGAPAVGPGAALGDVARKRAHDPNDHLLLMDMKSSVGSFYYESFAFPGMLPYKRPAADKSGMPVYQPGAYQQLMQPYVPVSCEYSAPSAPAPEPKEKAKLAAAALNYTGVSLNKQVSRGYAYPFAPQTYQTLPTTVHSPYLLRPATYPAVSAGQPPVLVGNPLLMASHATQVPPTTTTSASTAVAVVSENNNTSPQPYKKMKTT